MEWAVEVEDMTVAYTTKPVLWDVDMKVPTSATIIITKEKASNRDCLTFIIILL